PPADGNVEEWRNAVGQAPYQLSCLQIVACPLRGPPEMRQSAAAQPWPTVSPPAAGGPHGETRVLPASTARAVAGGVPALLAGAARAARSPVRRDAPHPALRAAPLV